MFKPVYKDQTMEDEKDRQPPAKNQTSADDLLHRKSGMFPLRNNRMHWGLLWLTGVVLTHTELYGRF